MIYSSLTFHQCIKLHLSSSIRKRGRSISVYFKHSNWLWININDKRTNKMNNSCNWCESINIQFMKKQFIEKYYILFSLIFKLLVSFSIYLCNVNCRSFAYIPNGINKIYKLAKVILTKILLLIFRNPIWVGPLTVP